MLVPVAIEGKKAAPQHIFYRQEKLTNDELAEINAAWLKQNATLIDIDALKTIVKQPLLPRKQAATQSTSETSQTQTIKSAPTKTALQSSGQTLRLNTVCQQKHYSNSIRTMKVIHSLSKSAMY